MNAPSGVVDRRPASLFHIERGRLCTKITGCAVAEPGRPASARAEPFLHELTGGDPECIGYLQRMCGSLTGATFEHALFLPGEPGGMESGYSRTRFAT